MRIVYYLEVVSSWCHWAEPAWKQLREHFAGRAEFEWRIALMDAGSMPVSRSQIEWFYRRSGTHMRSPYMLSSAWFQDGLAEYLAPNLVALAAKVHFGIGDDRARHAIAHAAVREGRPVAQWELCAEVAAAACGLDAAELLAQSKRPEIEAQARATTAEFHALQVTQRPTFVFENAIGDRAVFSGLAQAAPLVATGEAMLADAAYSASYRAHYGDPPAQ